MLRKERLPSVWIDFDRQKAGSVGVGRDRSQEQVATRQNPDSLDRVGILSDEKTSTARARTGGADAANCALEVGRVRDQSSVAFYGDVQWALGEHGRDFTARDSGAEAGHADVEFAIARRAVLAEPRYVGVHRAGGVVNAENLGIAQAASADVGGHYGVLAGGGVAEDNHFAVIGEVHTGREATCSASAQAGISEVVDIGQTAGADAIEFNRLKVRERNHNAGVVRSDADGRDEVRSAARGVVSHVGQLARSEERR